MPQAEMRRRTAHLVLRVFVDRPRAHARLVALLKRLVDALRGTAKGIRAAEDAALLER